MTSARFWIALLICLELAACASEASVTLGDGSATRRDAPRLFVHRDLTGNSILAVMPNGDQMTGFYTIVAAPAAFGLQSGWPYCGPACAAASAPFGSDVLMKTNQGLPAVAALSDGRGSTLYCNLDIDGDLRGSGKCKANTGAEYLVTF